MKLIASASRREQEQKNPFGKNYFSYLERLKIGVELNIRTFKFSSFVFLPVPYFSNSSIRIPRLLAALPDLLAGKKLHLAWLA